MSAEGRYGHELGTSFVMCPHALQDHLRALGLDSSDLAIIIALERFRWHPGQIVEPSEPTLARLAAMSRNKLRKRLREGALSRYVTVVPGQRGPDGRQRSASYDLDPLWEAVAEARQSQDRVPPGDTENVPEDDGHFVSRVPPGDTDRVPNDALTVFQTGASPCPPEVQEVEKYEVEKYEVEKDEERSAQATNTDNQDRVPPGDTATVDCPNVEPGVSQCDGERWSEGNGYRRCICALDRKRQARTVAA